MKVLVLLTDAHGGRGGIAQFNRDLLAALACYHRCEEVVVVPRLIQDPMPPIPDRVRYRVGSAGGKLAFLGHVMREVLATRFDAVICSHIHLLPVAAAVASMQRVPLVLVIYGIEAWKPPRRPLFRRLLRRVDAVVSISDFTTRHFLGWSSLPSERTQLIPCCVDLEAFGKGPKRNDLVVKHGLGGRTVILTLARLAGSERYKGFDEVMEVIPELARTIPTLTYLIAGDGPDRARLEAKARRLGIRDRVVFAGYISEVDKADYYRLADVFVMPGRGEGFGIVYLEAIASGVPVIASTLDASREAVRNGDLGTIVDPDRPEEIVSAILDALRRPRGVVPDGLEHFSHERFRRRWHRFLDELLARGRTGAALQLMK